MNILVVGDIIIDEYVNVTTERQAQEAPIPVFDELSRYTRWGGAANVAANIESFGKKLIGSFDGKSTDINVDLLGISKRVISANGEQGFNTRLLREFYSFSMCHLLSDDDIVKTRYIHNNKIVFRRDKNKKVSSFVVDRLHDFLTEVPLEKYDTIVFSDYDKGTLTGEIVQLILKDHDCPVIVDSKRKDVEIFAGATIAKFNSDEFNTQLSIRSEKSHVSSLFQYCVETQGPHGAVLHQYDERESRPGKYVVHTELFKTDKIVPVDVTGCGDVHTAVMAVVYTKTNDIRTAVALANKEATQSALELGTTSV